MNPHEIGKKDWEIMKSVENPFYDNHIFSKEDLIRAKFNKWNRLWLWLYPTFVQVGNSYAFHYKVINGAYWLIKSEKL